MFEKDTKWILGYYINYIKKIVNSRYGDLDKKVEEYIDMKLKDNLLGIDVGMRPIMNGTRIGYITCVIILTKKEEIFVFFDDDLPKMDSFSLTEIRFFLVKKAGTSPSTDG